MAYDIQDFDELQIYVTDGWREWYIPKFRIFMTVDEPICYLYWTDTEKGASGLTRLLALDYNDVTFGYLSPSSAGEVEIQINSYIVSAWTNIPIPPPPDLDAVLAAGNDGGALEITNIADGSASTSAATVGQLNNQVRMYTLNATQGTSAHTGTLANTIVYSFEIPANTLSQNDALELKWMTRKTTAGANNHQFAMYLNTSNAIGGDLIFLNTQGSATTLYFETFIKWLNSNTSYVAKQGAITPWGTNNGNLPLLATKDITASIWVILAVQLTNITDSVTTYLVQLMHHKNP